MIGRSSPVKTAAGAGNQEAMKLGVIRFGCKIVGQPACGRGLERARALAYEPRQKVWSPGSWVPGFLLLPLCRGYFFAPLFSERRTAVPRLLPMTISGFPSPLASAADRK